MRFPIKTIIIAAASLAAAAAYAAEVPTLDVSPTCTPIDPGDKSFVIDTESASKPKRKRANNSPANGRATRPRTGRCAHADRHDGRHVELCRADHVPRNEARRREAASGSRTDSPAGSPAAEVAIRRD